MLTRARDFELKLLVHLTCGQFLMSAMSNRLTDSSTPFDLAARLTSEMPWTEIAQTVWVLFSNRVQSLGVMRDYVEAANFVSQVVFQVGQISRIRHPSESPFSVTEVRSRPVITVTSVGLDFVYLLTNERKRAAAKLKIDYPLHHFHPYMDLYEFVDKKHPISTNGMLFLAIEKIATNYAYYNEGPVSDFGLRNLHHICAGLNTMFSEVRKFARDANGRVASFQKTPKENRRSLMSNVAYLAKKAPNFAICRYTIKWTPDTPVDLKSDHTESIKLRDHFLRLLKRQVKKNLLLGRSIFLHHSAREGYAFDVFVFLSEDIFNSAEKTALNLLGAWGALEVATKGACRIDALLTLQQNTRFYADLLQILMSAILFDFYLRPNPPDGKRRYWPSLSPAGKLSPRTSRKPSKQKVSDRATNPLLEDILNESAASEHAEIASKWERARERADKARSKSARKGKKSRNAQTEP